MFFNMFVKKWLHDFNHTAEQSGKAQIHTIGRWYSHFTDQDINRAQFTGSGKAAFLIVAGVFHKT